MLTYVAIPYQVYHLTGSSLAVGLLSLAALVPLLFTAFIGGAFADAVDRRRMLQFAEVALGLATGDPLSQLAPRRAEGLGALRRHAAHGRDRRLPAAGARLDGAAARRPRRADRGLGARLSARGIRHDRRAGRGRCPHRHDRSARDLRHRHRHIRSVGVRTRAHARRSAAEGRRAAERPAASSRA